MRSMPPKGRIRFNVGASTLAHQRSGWPPRWWSGTVWRPTMVTGAGPCLAIILAKLGSLPKDIMLLTRRCRRPKKWLASARAARKLMLTVPCKQGTDTRDAPGLAHVRRVWAAHYIDEPIWFINIPIERQPRKSRNTLQSSIRRTCQE